MSPKCRLNRLNKVGVPISGARARIIQSFVLLTSATNSYLDASIQQRRHRMSFPPPPGFLPPPPPGMPPQASASSSRMPPEGILRYFLHSLVSNVFASRLVIAQKSQKWVQMQRKRYGEKRKGGYVDMGKQVSGACVASYSWKVLTNIVGSSS
jgi:hypothetical protein